MKHSSLLYISLSIILAFTLAGCAPTPQPKPYGYFRIALPDHEYVLNDTLGNYTTEVSKHCVSVESRDISWATNADQWVNLHYPEINATIHLSYKKITPQMFKVVSEESRTLAYKHTIRADAIIEQFYANDTTRTYGILYQMEGNAASTTQFFLTDSSRHFLRGSVYFNAIPNSDSIAPVSAYIEQDVIHLIESLRWKE